MGRRVCVVDMPGLSQSLLRHIPAETALGKWLSRRSPSPLTPTFPAVTCSVQASLTTGQPPSKHGIIANGVATFRSADDQALVDGSNFAGYRKQVSFWEQSNQFLDVPRFWQGKYKTALLFFQNSMPGFSPPFRPAADIVLTPKPDHGPDGKLVSLCWSQPQELVANLFGQFGPFPLMNYWGPMAGLPSSEWIAKASAWVWEQMQPELQLVYIPHLDYDLQRFGPSSPQAEKAVADAAAAVEQLVNAVLASDGSLVLLSEYSMRDVTTCVSPNQLLADAGLLTTRSTPDGDLIDYDRSAAFAMVDHQIAHIYARDRQTTERARSVFAPNPNVSIVETSQMGLTHRRAGELLLLAAPHAWLDYRWWSDASAAPTFAKLVDIHRKPGYDPLELFWDRATNGVSQNTQLIRGSHGLMTDGHAVLVCDLPASQSLSATDLPAVVERLMQLH